jgi:hypothetical protein
VNEYNDNSTLKVRKQFDATKNENKDQKKEKSVSSFSAN